MEANPEHLAMLLSGVANWNAWRRKTAFILAPDLEDANLRGMDLRGADLSKVNLCAVRLAEANLEGASLIGANLSGTSLDRSVLRGVNFATANLQGTSLREADLSGALLAGTLLRALDLDGASLERADLRQSVFLGTRLKGARFGGAMLATSFCNVNLSEALGLDQVRHVRPSSFDIETLRLSASRLSKRFLGDAGVPEAFLGMMDSLVSASGSFQSCFISYASEDEAFARRLYADLRHEGVRCWFAPEDLKTGDRFRREIDNSILVHDRLLVILSRASIASAWVEDEVEAALERERRAGTDVLVPIRIDDEVLTTAAAWAASLRRTRHIGNFCGWDEDTLYSTSRARLLRDLRMTTPSPN